MPGEVKFCKNKKTYVGNFLVCPNIGYDCVLGWDFLVHNNLDLRGEMFRGTRSYHLVGSHGKTQAGLGTQKPPKFEAWDDFRLAQSNIKALVCVALENNVIIQGRCEMIVPGRLAKSPTHNIGMISPIHRADKKAPHQSLNCHVANAVVRPDGHSVPIPILNVLDKHIELCQGRKIAEFTPLVQSSSKQPSACCSVASQTSHEFGERAAEMNK